MSPWTYLLVGGLFGAISTVLITLGLNELKRRDEIYSLSTPPFLEIEYAPAEGQPVVRFRNAGAHTIVNVEVYPVAYTVAGSPLAITNRMQPAGDMRLIDKLGPNETFTQYANRFTLMYEGDEPTIQRLNFIALVVVYRRQIDNKRFVTIEPFLLSDANEAREMSALYSNTHWSQSGSPATFLAVVKEIVDTEKAFFRAN